MNIAAFNIIYTLYIMKYNDKCSICCYVKQKKTFIFYVKLNIYIDFYAKKYNE